MVMGECTQVPMGFLGKTGECVCVYIYTHTYMVPPWEVGDEYLYLSSSKPGIHGFACFLP